MNDIEIEPEFIKSKNGRISLETYDEGLVHILSIKDVNMSDNASVYALCENTAKSDVAALKAVPIVFETTPKDVKICATETAKFEVVTNKAEVEVNETFSTVYLIGFKLTFSLDKKKLFKK